MIWNDTAIHMYCIDGDLVTPYEPSLVNPASIDLRLGSKIRKAYTRQYIRHGEMMWTDAEEFVAFYLYPGEFVLCHSLEYVKIPLIASAVLYSKSSTGRIGLEHLHAGYIDPGFEGQLTFEFHNVAPWTIELRAGMRVMQMVLHQLNGPPLVGYEKTGRYQGQTGPTLAR